MLFNDAETNRQFRRGQVKVLVGTMIGVAFLDAGLFALLWRSKATGDGKQ